MPYVVVLMSWDNLKPDIYTTWKTYWFATHPPDVAAYSWNYLFTGGKEIRARLFCELWGYLSPDLGVCGELAFAIECIHVASIVLDDTPWMDNAAQRRGRRTLHVEFSPKKAVLIASELMDIVRHIWRTCRPPHVAIAVWEGLLVQKLKMLAIGQLYDLEKKGTLMELATLKTGVLFELVTETVAVCVGLDTGFWRQWGRSLGVLFQWMDDWQDREEDVAQGNRNAFLEAYDDTLVNYRTIWRSLTTGIGSSWFLRPFGIFMAQYFTQGIIDSGWNNETVKSSLMEQLGMDYSCHLIVPEYTGSFSFRGAGKTLTGKEMVVQLIRDSSRFFDIPSLRTHLWGVNEDEWECVPEVNDVLSLVVGRT